MANQMGMVFSKLDCKPRWRERLPEIEVPTLVVHGRRDPFFPVGNGEAIAREIPGARLLVLEEAATAIPDAAAGDDLPTHRGSRTDRGSPDGGARRHRRDDRLVLLPAVRLAERVRVPARRPSRRSLRLGAGHAGATTKQMYIPDTAILVTRFLSESGIAEVVDFMPIDRPHVVSDRRRIVRAVRGIRGEVEFEASVEPRFDYGRRSHRLHVDGTTAVFEAGDQRLQLTSVAPLERDGDDVRSRFTVRAGDTSGFLLESGAVRSPQRIGGGEVIRLFLDTVAYWQRWLEQSSYQGALAGRGGAVGDHAQAHDLRAVGGLVAAPTAGLPEQVGGSRNWDYRYTWVRDGAFSVFALLGLGFTEEATAFGEWLRAAWRSMPATARGRSRSCTASTAAPS